MALEPTEATALAQIQRQLATLVSDVAVIKQQVMETRDIARENQRALRGFDGEPGLVARTREVERVVHEERLKCPIDDVVILLYGDRDDKNSIGLVEEVRYIREWIDKRERWSKLFIGAVIVAVVDVAIHAIPTIMQVFSTLNGG